MGLLDAIHRVGGHWYSPGGSDSGYSLDEVKAELATREHVPNKPEAKALRREAAQGRGPRG